MSPCVALVVFGVVCLLLATMVIVGRMRGKHGIQAPAVSGHPMFERAYRVKMHTLLDLRGNIPSFIHISDGTSCCAWYRLPIAAKNPRLISSVRWYAFLCCWKILDVLKNVCPQPPAQLVDVLKKCDTSLWPFNFRAMGEMNTVRCTIKYQLVVSFFFMALVASAFVSAKSPMDASNRRALSNVSQTFTKVVSPADPGYEWMYGLVGGNATLAAQVELKVHFPKGHPALVSTKGSASSIVSTLVFGKMSKNLGVPDGPEPGYDGRLGQQDSTRLGCAVVSQGTNFYHADVDYEWEWRYRTDSDNDGVNDSNPGWVLTKVDIKFLQPNVASICP